MEYKNLGNSGLQVSVVGLGCNTLREGGMADIGVGEPGARAVIDRQSKKATPSSILQSFYGGGMSEEFLRRELKPHRHDVVLAIRAGGWTGEGPYSRGTSRK